jgi:tetratricopeptide (TPR) repeat protein
MDAMEEALDAALEDLPGDPLLLTLAGDAAYYRADFDASMNLLSRAIEAIPARGGRLADPLGEMALVSMQALEEYTPGYEKRLEEALEPVLPDLYRKTDASYFVALETRVRSLARAGRFDESRALARDGGCLTGWTAAGPFGDTELLGFDDTHPIESDIPWRAAYPLRDGEDPVETLRAKSFFCNVSIEPEGGFRGGTWYAAADLTVRREGDYVFRMHSSHSTTVLVDGVEVLTVDRRFEEKPDIFLFNLKLSRGEHLIVLKLGTRSPMPGFSLMWKEAASTSPDPSAQPAILARPHGGALSATAPPPGRASLVPMLEPASDVEAIVLSEVALYRNDIEATRRALEPLRESHGDSASVLPRLVTLEWNDPFAPFHARMNRVRALVEKTIGLHPSLWVSHYLLARIEANQDRTEEAIEALMQGLEKVGPFAGYHIMLANLYAYKGWSGESVASFQAAADLLDGNCLGLAQEFQVARTFGDLDGMEAVARDISACDATDSTLLEVLIERQEWEAVDAEQRRLQQVFPDRDEYLLDQAQMALKLGDVEGYVEGLERYHGLHPTDFGPMLKLVDRYLAAREKGEAIDLLERARAMLEGPTDDISQQIAYLEGFDYLYPFRRDARTAIAAYEAETGGATDGSTPSVEVLDHVTHRIFPDGSSITRYHSVRKMLTREGVEMHSEFAPPAGAALIQLRTIKADGRVLQPEDIANKTTLSFPSLEPGDYTEAEWIQAEGASTIFDRGFNLARWYFQVLDLVLYYSEMIVVLPADMHLDVDPRGSPPPLEDVVEGPLRVMRWTARNMPHRKGEPASPNFSEFLPSLQLSHNATWDRYFEWVADMLVDQDMVSPRMREKVEELTEGIPERDAAGRARAIYRWVTDEIDEGEGIDVPVSHIFEDRVGNRARLFRAMLGAAGVESELWVVRSIYADHTETTVPSFNVYTLFAVKVGDDWLVPLADTTPYGTLPYAMRAEEAVRLFPSPARASTPGDDAFDDHVERRLEMEVLPSGRSEAVLTETFNGLEAALMRAALRQLPRSEIEKEIEGSYLAPMFSGASLTDLELSDLDEPSTVMSLRMTFTLPAMAGPLPGTIALGPFLKSHLSKIWTTLPTRNFPLLIDEPTDYRVTIVLDTGGKWQVFQPPAPASKLETAQGGLFTQTFEQKGGALTLERTVKLPAGRVSPGEYPALLDFTTRIDENEGGVFLLVRKP